MSFLAERLLAVHDALTDARLPHAIGGAIALAYCTEEPRGTRDLDINVFVEPRRFRDVVAALPHAIDVQPKDFVLAERDGQVRVFWDETPIDIFLNNVPFHEEVQGTVRVVDFMERKIPVLDCTSLAVFKAMFDRTQDWADIEAMLASGAIDIERMSTWVEQMAPEAQVRKLDEACARTARTDERAS